MFQIIKSSDHPEADHYVTVKSYWWKILDNLGGKFLMFPSASGNELEF